jgi:hypothetical protein
MIDLEADAFQAFLQFLGESPGLALVGHDPWGEQQDELGAGAAVVRDAKKRTDERQAV